MTNEIVKINASDYGLDSTRAKEIEAMFTPMLNKMKELEGNYNEIIKLPISHETCESAKKLRLQYVNIRTKTAEIHKELKSFYLNGGRFVDGWKNAQLFASQEIEDTLKKIETHYEIIETQRKEKIKNERTELIQPFVENVNTFMLGEMSQDAFDILLAGAKSQYEARIAAEKKAEEDRLAAIKAERIRQEKIRFENIRLQKEAKEREKQMAAEREKAEKATRELEEKARKEREAREAIEAELKAKEDARLKYIEDAKREKAEAEKKMRLAPDKDKLLAFMQAINDIPRPEVKTIEAASIAANANAMLIQSANYIRDNAHKL